MSENPIFKDPEAQALLQSLRDKGYTDEQVKLYFRCVFEGNYLIPPHISCVSLEEAVSDE